MTGALCEMRDINCKSRERRSADYGMANALARKVRRDYPAAILDGIAADYGLTTGEARGVLYGTASRATIDKALKRGGWALAVELFSDVLGQPLEDYIEQEARRAADERKQWEATERRLVSLEARYLSSRPGGDLMDGPGSL